MNNKWTKRIWAWIMIGCMLFTMVPALAEDGAVAEPPVVEEPAVEAPAEPAPEAAPVEPPVVEEPPVEQPAPEEPPVVEEPPVEQPAIPDEPAEQPAPETPAEPEVEVPEVEVPGAEAPAGDEVHNPLIMVIAGPEPETRVTWSGGISAQEASCTVHKPLVKVKDVQDAAAAQTITQTIDKQADCKTETDGYAKYQCPSCESQCFIYIPFEHEFVRGEQLTEATCQDAYDDTGVSGSGKKTPQYATYEWVCSVCQKTEVRVAPGYVEHVYIERVAKNAEGKLLEGDCLNGAKYGQFCKWCYKAKPGQTPADYRTGEPLGHQWSRKTTEWVTSDDRNFTTYRVCERVNCPGWTQGDGTDATGVFDPDNNPSKYGKYDSGTFYLLKNHAEKEFKHTAQEHNFTTFNWVPPTCAQDGYWTETCEICGCTYKEGDTGVKTIDGGYGPGTPPPGQQKDKHGHEPDRSAAWVPMDTVDGKATTNADHMMGRPCLWCGKFITQAYLAQHKQDVPGGEGEGVATVRKCFDTSGSYTEGKTWHKETVTATCQQAGGTYCVCDLCGYRYEQESEAKKDQHNFDPDFEGNKITKQATCTSAGSMIMVCTWCGVDDTKTTTIDAGHSYELRESESTQPDCLNPGMLVYYCTNPKCTGTPGTGETSDTSDSDGDGLITTYRKDTASGAFMKIETYQALGHTWDPKYDKSGSSGADERTTKTTVPPDCRGDGYYYFTCDRCGAESEHTTISGTADTSSNHKWSAEPKHFDADCVNPERTAYVCEICGTVGIYTLVPGGEKPTGHVLQVDESRTPASVTKKCGVKQTLYWFCTNDNCPGGSETNATIKEWVDWRTWMGDSQEPPATYKVEALSGGVWTTTDATWDNGNRGQHRWVAKDVAATCTTDMIKGVDSCEICGEAFDQSKYSAALSAPQSAAAGYPGTTADGHTPSAGKTVSGSRLGHDFVNSAWITKDPALANQKDAVHVHIRFCQREGCIFNEANYSDDVLKNTSGKTKWYQVPSGDDATIGIFKDNTSTKNFTVVEAGKETSEKQTKVITPATCKAPAKITYTCNDCGWSTTVTAVAQGSGENYAGGYKADPNATPNQYAHVFKKDDPSTIVWDEGKEATCVSAGSGWYKCTVCGAVPHWDATTTSGDSNITAEMYNKVENDAAKQHHWVLDSSYTESADPTCLKDGKVRYICDTKGCQGKILPSDTAAAKDDDNISFDDESKPGTIYKYEYQPATGHTWSEEAENVADPENPGKLIPTYTCTNPNCDGFDETPGADNKGATGENAEGKAIKEEAAVDCDHAALKEAVEAGTATPTSVKTAATCVAKAVGIFTCDVCKKADIELEYGEVDTSEAGHSYGEPVETTKADCVTKGVTTKTCTLCGEETEGHSITTEGDVDPSNHKGPEVDGEEIPATCTKPGQKAGKICEACGQPINEGDVIPATGHSYEHEGDPTFEGVITYDATDCTKPATRVRTCSVCGEDEPGHSVTDTVDGKAEHDFTVEIEPGVDATCTTEGKTPVLKCSICAVQKASEVIDALGHDWDEGVETKAATCTEEGEKLFTCQRCGETETRTVEKIPHDFQDSDMAAANCEYPSMVGGKVCTKCGAPDPDNPPQVLGDSKPMGHSWVKSSESTPVSCTDPTVVVFVCDRSNCPGWISTNEHAQPDDQPGEGIEFTTNAEGKAQKTVTTPGKDHVPDKTSGRVLEADCVHGTSRVYDCEVCGQLIYFEDLYATHPEGIPGVTLEPATGHKWGNWTTNDATNRLQHTHTAVCTNPNCPGYDATWTSNGDATGENAEGKAVKTGKPATWQQTTTPANHHDPAKTTYTCPDCGATFTENVPGSVPDPNAHIWTEDGELNQELLAPACDRPGIGLMVCEEDLVSGDYYEIDPLGHTWERDGFDINDPANQTEANGWVLDEGSDPATGHYECLVCGEPSESVPAACNHAALWAGVEDGSIQPDRVEPATCVEGETAYYTCPTCGTEQKQTKATPDTVNGHQYDEGVTTPGDCVTPATTVYTCTLCDETVENHTKTEEGELDPNTHKGPIVDSEAADPTCTKPGHAAGKVCEACGQPTEPGAETAPAKGHTWERDDFDINDPANQTAENGWVLDEGSDPATGHYECTDPDCDDKEHNSSESVPAANTQPETITIKVTKEAVIREAADNSSTLLRMAEVGETFTAQPEPVNGFYEIDDAGTTCYIKATYCEVVA